MSILSEPVFAFIGTGNMGGALARAASKTIPGDQILLANRTEVKAAALAEDIGAHALSVREAAERGDFLFLGVKPQNMGELFNEIRPILAERTTPFVLVSMAAGLTLSQLHELAGIPAKILRIMPNTPASVCEGTILYTPDELSEEEVQLFLDGMAAAGLFVKIPESQMDAASAVAGCGPAFVDLFAEALADGGVACGLPRATASLLAQQMIRGSAALLIEEKLDPAVAKNAVCSPGGTTIQGVRALERGAFRSAVVEAVIASYEKSRAFAK